jgi:hypothetical protein
MPGITEEDRFPINAVGNDEVARFEFAGMGSTRPSIVNSTYSPFIGYYF